MKIIRSILDITRRFRNTERNMAIILAYHRVTRLDSDPQLLAVAPENFREHLAALKKHFSVVSLQVLHEQMLRKRVLPGTVVITLDDGYEDNLLFACPLLEEYSIPATIFVSTGLVDTDREFWWDDLERIFIQPGDLPEYLSLGIEGKTLDYCFKDVRFYSQENHQLLKSWSVLEPSVPTPRHQAYMDLCSVFRELDYSAQVKLLQELYEWSGKEPQGRTSHRVLSSDSLKKLGKSDVVEIGAHSEHHCVLSGLTNAQQNEEIVQCKKKLKDILDEEIISFSYPFGGKVDYNISTLALLKNNGFELSCSNYPGPVRWDTNPFELPRTLIRNWSGDKLLEHLAPLFGQ